MQFCPRCQRSVVVEQSTHPSPDGKTKHVTGTCSSCKLTLYRTDEPLDDE